ncbi:SHOCT domain-containing protein [Microbacterium terricola]|uniref:Membrane protein n=1 Tax=Microbacterium terricola TaxID=344163 RepID=A0ABM8DYF5_9MICO|nr:SHOCT domain-containing protein [Microbacterium terricola]UYK38758.1 SHOCT domain-containing protein [Microbacterium terricola]BDV30550.1 membrane protein [Microbacterium terricola]
MFLGDFFWMLLWFVYVVSYFFVVIFVIMDLFRDDTVGGWGKAAWIFFLIFVPLITALVYVIARGSGIAERARAEHYRAPEEDSYRPSASTSPADDIARAQQLLDAGTITQGEFDALKSKALGNQYFGA